MKNKQNKGEKSSYQNSKSNEIIFVVRIHLSKRAQRIQIKYEFNITSTNIQFLMSGKLNKQEQVQVVIRLKPQSEEHAQVKSVYVSDDQQKALVVETPYKKELFVFDNIADQNCTQKHLYEQIGQDVLKSSTEGFNCCIFAYGQTGAGKTYSILGRTTELTADIYCESRGIMPRLLHDLYNWHKNEVDRWEIKCSYMEIYNEQIFDLLNTQDKNRHIREDLKRGVFVEGLSEENIMSYEEAMKVVMKGVKNRKISTTSMNNQSSRSHTIFTMNIEFELKQGQSVKTRKSKIHIVDLAGSERAKQTKVEGERLKEGCNINKSLHVLGNVINALVESSKKKKHIPFRDSKLTHFLKDSLCGNSVTKLLANIHPSKTYLGQTLSTLIFAKRAKILKMKVQTNENVTQNFQQLRKEIKKLRQQLAEARYIKNQSKVTERHVSQFENDTQIWERMNDISGFDLGKSESVLKVFEENQLNYKALVQIYEQHLKICNQTSGVRKSMNMHKQWKILEKKNEAYRNLIKNMPAFTKIFNQNIILRNQAKKQQKQEDFNRSFVKLEKEDSIMQDNSQKINKQEVNKVIEHYESLIKEIEHSFASFVKKLQTTYEQLDLDNKAKDQKIKDLLKRKELPPNLQQFQNENEYLKLNIMEFEDQIAQYQKKIIKLQIELKEVKKQARNSLDSNSFRVSQSSLKEEEYQSYLYELNDIKKQLQQDAFEYQKSQKQMESYIQRIQKQFKKKIEQNKAINQELDILAQQNKELKKKLNQLLKIDNETEINKDNNISTFMGIQQSNISEELMQMDFVFDRKNLEQRNKLLSEIQKEQNLRLKAEKQLSDQIFKNQRLNEEIQKINSSYKMEIFELKQTIKEFESIKQIGSQKMKYLNDKIYIYDQFNEPLTQRQGIKQSFEGLKRQENTLQHTKSHNNLRKYKQPLYEEKLTKKERKEKIEQLRKKVSTDNLHKKVPLRIKDEQPQDYPHPLHSNRGH